MIATITPTPTDTDRMALTQAEIVARLDRVLQGTERREALPGVWLRRAEQPTTLTPGVSSTAICVTVQGSKSIFVGESHYRYDPNTYLITTAALPVSSAITEASPAEPFMSVVMELSPLLVSSVLAEAESLPTSTAPVRAIGVSRLDANLLDAVVRTVRLLDNPGEAALLVPLIRREIVLRLLMGEQGDRLHQMIQGGPANPVIRAIRHLHDDLDRPLRVEDLAADLGMSASSFHHHFKAVTAMSPLQFQKRLRLQEARRLMLAEHLDAASAGFRVGYDDPSHFSREYKRHFGEPPARDIERLRQSPLPTEPAAP